MLLHLVQHHLGLVVVTIVDEGANFADRLVSLNRLLELTDAQGAVDHLLATVCHLLQALEVQDGWLHVVLGLLLLLVHLEAHEPLHLHQLIWNHAELLILRVITRTLRVEHHLHVHVWVNVVHSLTGESHLILHHHAWELVHVLHAIHAHRLRHLVA